MNVRVILVAALIALGVAPFAAADPPVREVLPAPQDFVIDDQCAFPVLVHAGAGTTILTTRLVRHGTVFKLDLMAPGGKETLTNLATGATVTVAAAGQVTLKIDSDGSGYFKETGRSLSVVGDPATGEPGIFLTDGLILATFDAAGNETSFTAPGTAVNLCSALATS